LTELNVDQGPVISGKPCWIPGSPDRVVYPAGDGKLYVQELHHEDGQGNAETRRNSSHSAQALTWECDLPVEGAFILSEPVLHFDPAFDGRMIVILTRMRSPGKKQPSQFSELWSLKFDQEMLAIVEATRLTEPEAENARVDERLANLTMTSRGQPVIAFLKRSKVDQTWGLRIARLSIDETPGRQHTKRDDEIEVANDHAVTIPCLSPDRRWIYTISRCSAPADSVTRIELSETLAKFNTSKLRPSIVGSAGDDKGAQR
jgi:hypothetical protein